MRNSYLSKKKKIENPSKKIKKNSFNAFLNKIGSALIFPISLLPFVGILFSFSIILNFIGLSYFSFFIKGIVDYIFQLFPILVVLAISFKFSKTESGYIVLNSFFCLLIFFIVQSIFIEFNLNINTKYDGIFIVDGKNISYYLFSIFNSIILGLFFSFIFNKTFYKNNNNNYSLFIMSSFTIFFTIFFVYVWVFVLIIIFFFSKIISILPLGIDNFIYGFLNRIFVLFGLHTVIMSFFLYTPIGGVLYENGTVIAQGDTFVWVTSQSLEIPLQYIREGIPYGDYTFSKNLNPGQYQQGFLPILIFCFPVAGYKMYQKNDKNEIGKVIFLTSFIPLLTGITEPFEYLFIFNYFWLYIIHSILTGFSFMLLDLLNVSVFLSTGWFLDLLLFGVIPQYFLNSITNYYYVIPVGIFLSIFYYFSFEFFYYNN